MSTRYWYTIYTENVVLVMAVLARVLYMCTLYNFLEQKAAKLDAE